MKSYEIAVVGTLGPFVPRPAQHVKIVSIDEHTCVVTGPVLRWSNCDNSGETPVYHILRKMELEPPTLVVGQVVPVGSQTIRAGHRIGGLGAQ